INVVAPWRKCSSCGCRQVRGWIVGRKYVEGLPGLILQEIAPCVKIILLNEGQDLKGPACGLMLWRERRAIRTVGDAESAELVLPAGGSRKATVGVMKIVNGQPYLLEIVGAGYSVGCFADLLHRRQQQSE